MVVVVRVISQIRCRGGYFRLSRLSVSLLLTILISLIIGRAALAVDSISLSTDEVRVELSPDGFITREQVVSVSLLQ